jgi:hypothetical protein
MNLQKTFFTICAFLAFVGVLSSVTPAPAVQAASSQFTFKSVADSYATEIAPDTNFGTNPSIRVDASPILQSYIRFDVTGLEGQVTSAKLRIFANSAAGSGYSVKSVDDTSWDEAAITWNNAPAIGNLINESGPVSAGQWTSVDVTAAVKNSGLISLAVTGNGVTAINLAARESGSGTAPQLEVITETSPVSTTPPTSTATPTQPTAATPIPTETGIPTQAPSATATPTPAPTQPPAGNDEVFVGAGDISRCGNNGDDQTARLLGGINGTIFTLGDNAYESGTTAQFRDCFDPTWGQFKDRIRPSAGNHEYLTSGAAGYYAYFGSAAGAAGQGYYSYNLGAWHIVVLNSNCSAVGGCGTGSAQEKWLRADLAANPSQCTLAYWHHPRFSSGSEHGNSTAVQPLWQALYDNGGEIVLSGHDHNYERFAPQTPSGGSDPLKGIREFVVGTGGAGTRSMGATQPNSEVRNGSTLGVLKLTLGSGSYSWNFIPVAGKTFTDSGSDVCH